MQKERFSFQTGHGASLADGEPLSDDHKMDLAAKDHIQWIDRVYAEEPHKPVIILEGMYELNEGTEHAENSRAMVRHQAYLKAIPTGVFSAKSISRRS